MPVFIVTYDLHLQRDYDELYAAMEEHDGVRLAESVWGLELNNTPAQVRDWMRHLLDDDDTIVVIQLKPKPSWAARHGSKAAVAWLKRNAKD